MKEACAEDSTWLEEIVTNGDLELEDAERLRLIGVLYSNARGRYAFAVDLWRELTGMKKRKS